MIEIFLIGYFTRKQEISKNISNLQDYGINLIEYK